LEASRKEPQRSGVSRIDGRQAKAGKPAVSKEAIVLVLSRKPGESLVFPDLGISVFVCETRGDRVRLGIVAPDGVLVLRDEVLQRIRLGEPLRMRPADGSAGGSVAPKE
jgi:carbon storage regulator CsrA